MGNSLSLDRDECISEVFGGRRQAFDPGFVVALLVRGSAFVDIGVSPSEHAIDPLRELAGGREHRDVGAEALGDAAVVRPECGVTPPQRRRRIRRAAPTRALALAGFFRFRTGFPPLIGL